MDWLSHIDLRSNKISNISKGDTLPSPFQRPLPFFFFLLNRRTTRGVLLFQSKSLSTIRRTAESHIVVNVLLSQCVINIAPVIECPSKFLELCFHRSNPGIHFLGKIYEADQSPSVDLLQSLLLQQSHPSSKSGRFKLLG